MKRNIRTGVIAFITCISISLCGCGEGFQSEREIMSSAGNQQKEESKDDTVSESEKTTETAEEEQETTTETTTTEQETTTETTTTIPPTEAPATVDPETAVQNGDYSLVTPEFKQLMDEYEAFYNNYLEFMNKYTSGEGDIMSMLGDYTNMLNQLSEWTDRITQIDTSTLSPADSAYYFLVTLRVEQKLLGSLG